MLLPVARLNGDQLQRQHLCVKFWIRNKNNVFAGLCQRVNKKD